jgi:hypothetical protein
MTHRRQEWEASATVISSGTRIIVAGLLPTPADEVLDLPSQFAAFGLLSRELPLDLGQPCTEVIQSSIFGGLVRCSAEQHLGGGFGADQVQSGQNRERGDGLGVVQPVVPGAPRAGAACLVPAQAAHHVGDRRPGPPAGSLEKTTGLILERLPVRHVESLGH